ncbi:hypothetical protein V6Z11_A01G001700 [Gossypium hirsutum]
MGFYDTQENIRELRVIAGNVHAAICGKFQAVERTLLACIVFLFSFTSQI